MSIIYHPIIYHTATKYVIWRREGLRHNDCQMPPQLGNNILPKLCLLSINCLPGFGYEQPQLAMPLSCLFLSVIQKPLVPALK